MPLPRQTFSPWRLSYGGTCLARSSSNDAVTTLALALVALFGGTASFGALPPDSVPPITTVVAADRRFAALRTELIEKVRAARIPSIAISVSEGGRTIWEEAIGWADRERRIPATPGTTYALGSLSKSLTGTALLTLVDRGAIDLDGSLDRWVRLQAPTGIHGQPTLRQLLDASAGVPHGSNTMTLAAAPVTRADWDAWIERNAFLAFAPGVVFEYSNNSFGVAARVAERVTGLTFDEFIRANLFVPLGMLASRAVLTPALAGAVAIPYGARGTPLPRVAEVPEAGLGMFASAPDLARFGRFVRGDPLPQSAPPPLTDQARRLLWQPSSGPSRGFFHFGFWNGGRTLVTNGNISGANAHLAIGRDRDVVVAVTVNQTGSDADEAAGTIIGLLLPPAPGEPDIRAAYEALYGLPYRAPESLRAVWSGEVLVGRETLSMALETRADSALVRFGEGPWMPVGRLRLTAFGELHGSITASIPGLTASDSGALRVDMTLRWEGDLLRGYLLPRDTNAQPLAVRLAR